MDKPRRGSLAMCSLGCLGLITEDEPKEIAYSDGNKGFAYVGIHLTDKICPIGSPWSSRNPKVIGHTDSILDKYLAELEFYRDTMNPNNFVPH